MASNLNSNGYFSTEMSETVPRFVLQDVVIEIKAQISMVVHMYVP
jgi:hypothetical protein